MGCLARDHPKVQGVRQVKQVPRKAAGKEETTSAMPYYPEIQNIVITVFSIR